MENWYKNDEGVDDCVATTVYTIDMSKNSTTNISDLLC